MVGATSTSTGVEFSEDLASVVGDGDMAEAFLAELV